MSTKKFSILERSEIKNRKADPVQPNVNDAFKPRVYSEILKTRSNAGNGSVIKIKKPEVTGFGVDPLTFTLKNSYKDPIYNRSNDVVLVDNEQQPIKQVNVDQVKNQSDIALKQLQDKSLKTLANFIDIENTGIELNTMYGISNNQISSEFKVNDCSDYKKYLTIGYPDFILDSINENNDKANQIVSSFMGYLPQMDWAYFVNNNSIIIWNYSVSNSFYKIHDIKSEIIDVNICCPSKNSFTEADSVKYLLLILTKTELLFYSIIDEGKENGNANNYKSNFIKQSSPYLDGFIISRSPYNLNISQFTCLTLDISGKNRIFIGCDKGHIFEVVYYLEFSKLFGMSYIVKKQDIIKENPLKKVIPSIFGLRTNFACKKIIFDNTRHLMYALFHKMSTDQNLMDIELALDSHITVFDMGIDGKDSIKKLFDINQRLIHDKILDEFNNSSKEFVIRNKRNIIFSDLFVVDRSESKDTSLIIVTRGGFRAFVTINYSEAYLFLDREEFFVLDKLSIVNRFKVDKANLLTHPDKYLFISVSKLYEPKSFISNEIFKNIKERETQNKLSKSKRKSETSSPQNFADTFYLDNMFYLNKKFFIVYKDVIKNTTKLDAIEISMQRKNESLVYYNNSDSNEDHSANNLVPSSMNVSGISVNFWNKQEEVSNVSSFDSTRDIYHIYKLKPKPIFSELNDLSIINKFIDSYSGKSISKLGSPSEFLDSSKSPSANCLPSYQNQYFFYGEEYIIFSSGDLSLVIKQRPIDCLYDVLESYISYSGGIKRTGENESIKGYFDYANSTPATFGSKHLNDGISKPQRVLNKCYEEEHEQSKTEEKFYEFLKMHGVCETTYMLICIMSSPNYTFFSYRDYEEDGNKSMVITQMQSSQRLIETASFFLLKLSELNSKFYTIELQNISKPNDHNNQYPKKLASNLDFYNRTLQRPELISKQRDFTSTVVAKPFIEGQRAKINYLNYGLVMFLARTLRFFFDESVFKPILIANEHFESGSVFSEMENAKYPNKEAKSLFSRIKEIFSHAPDTQSNLENGMPKIKKSIKSNLSPIEIDLLRKILTDFKAMLSSRKDHFIELASSTLRNKGSSSILHTKQVVPPELEALSDFSSIKDDIDEVFFIVDKTLESLNFAQMISNLKNFKNFFTSNLKLDSQIEYLNITFKNLLYQNNQSQNIVIKHLIEDYFESFTYCSDEKGFSDTVDLIHNSCPSFMSASDKELIYANYILKICQSQNETSNNYNYSNNENLLLGNAIQVICSNPLHVRLEAVISVLSDLKNLGCIMSVCLSKASAVLEILAKFESEYSQAIDNDIFDIKNMQMDASWKNDNFKSFISFHTTDLRRDQVGTYKKELKRIIMILIKIIDEIDFRLVNCSSPSEVPKMNDLLLKSKTFPTFMLNLFLDRKRIIASKDQHATYLEELLEWKKMVIQSILNSKVKPLKHVLFSYLIEEGKFDDILTYKSDAIQAYLQQQHDLNPNSIQTLVSLYKYHSFTSKDNDKILLYLTRLIFYENSAQYNLLLSDRKNYCRAGLILLNTLEKENDYDILKKYKGLKARLERCMDTLSLQEDFKIYLQSLLNLNSSSSTQIKEAIYQDINKIDANLFEIDEIFEIASKNYFAYEVAITASQLMFKYRIDYNDTDIRNMHQIYMNKIVESSVNVQESLVYYLNKVFNVDFVIYGADTLNDLFLNNSPYLNKVMHIDDVVKNIENYNLNIKKINEQNTRASFATSKDNISVSSKSRISGFFSKVNLDFKQKNNPFWLASYFIDYLKVSCYPLFNYYVSLALSNKNDPPKKYILLNYQLIVSSAYILYRLINRTDEYDARDEIKTQNLSSILQDYCMFNTNKDNIRAFFVFCREELSQKNSDTILKVDNSEEIQEFIKEVEQLYEKKLNIMSVKEKFNNSRFSLAESKQSIKPRNTQVSERQSFINSNNYRLISSNQNQQAKPRKHYKIYILKD